jgi:hypothetical protein
MCGELFNRRIRDAVFRRVEKPVAIIDLAHTLAGFRPTKAMEDIARNGVHAFCSGHASKRGAIKHHYAPGGYRESSNDADFHCGQKPHLEAKVWVV